MTDGKKMRTINALRILLLALGAAFVILGIARGEHTEVLGKAVRICLECIGIG